MPANEQETKALEAQLEGEKVRVSKMQDRIREVIDLLNQTRDTFRSKQVERARRMLEELL